MGPAARTAKPRSASRISRSGSSATWCSSSCPRSGRTGEAGRVVRHDRVGEGGVGAVLAGVGRGGRRQRRRSATHPEAVNAKPHETWMIRLQAERAGRGRTRCSTRRVRRSSTRPSGRSTHVSDTFQSRHLGPRAEDIRRMLAAVGAPSLDALIDEIIPADIRLAQPLALPRSRDRVRVSPAPARRSRRRTACAAATSASAITTRSRRRSFSATSSRIPAGTRPTRPIRPRSRRAASSRSSISRRW